MSAQLFYGHCLQHTALFVQDLLLVLEELFHEVAAFGRVGLPEQEQQVNLAGRGGRIELSFESTGIDGISPVEAIEAKPELGWLITVTAFTVDKAGRLADRFEIGPGISQSSRAQKDGKTDENGFAALN